MTPIRSRGLFSRLHETAPVVSIAAALVLPHALPHDPSASETNGVELEMVAAAVDAVPWRIGHWVGRDIPIPEAARRLLRPNAILSRRFVHLGSGMALDLAIVHCGDSRDMLGHYPPVCYPSNGWVKTSQFTLGVPGGPGADAESPRHGDAVELESSGIAIPARMYAYSRMRGWSDESHIRIFNFFVLPDGTITRDIEDVGLRTNWLGASVQGVAQIQILTDALIAYEDASVAANEVLEGVTALFDSLGVTSRSR